jgi:hypothetical protein
MKKGVVKLVIFNGEDFGYWKNRTLNYLLRQGHAIWEIIQEAYVIPYTLDHATQGELQKYENNYKMRGRSLLGAASSAVTPPTSSPTAPRGRSSTPLTSTTATTGTTPAIRVRARRSTASGTRRRRSSRR